MKGNLKKPESQERIPFKTTIELTEDETLKLSFILGRISIGFLRESNMIKYIPFTAEDLFLFDESLYLKLNEMSIKIKSDRCMVKNP